MSSKHYIILCDHIFSYLRNNEYCGQGIECICADGRNGQDQCFIHDFGIYPEGEGRTLQDLSNRPLF